MRRTQAIKHQRIFFRDKIMLETWPAAELSVPRDFRHFHTTTVGELGLLAARSREHSTLYPPIQAENPIFQKNPKSTPLAPTQKNSWLRPWLREIDLGRGSPLRHHFRRNPRQLQYLKVPGTPTRPHRCCCRTSVSLRRFQSNPSQGSRRLRFERRLGGVR